MILPTLPPKMLPALSHLANSLHTIGDYYVAGDVDAALNVAREEPLMLPLGAVIGGLALASRGGSHPKPPPTLLAGTNLDGKPLRLAYKASRDGWGAERFHDRVDFCGSALVVAASGGAVAGGYNPSGWASTDDYSSSTSAFVFAIERSGVWHRMGTTGGAAIYDNARSGPTFGSDALVVGAGMAPVMGGFAGPDTESMQQQGSLRSASSFLGSSYNRGPPPYEVSLFGGRRTQVRLREVEVWVADTPRSKAPYREKGGREPRRTLAGRASSSDWKRIFSEAGKQK